MCLSFVITLLCVKFTLQSMCTDISNFPHLNTSYTVEGPAIEVKSPLGLMSCVDKCKWTGGCDVFTYDLEKSKCSLYKGYTSTTTNNSNTVISSKLKDWFKEAEEPGESTLTKGREVNGEGPIAHTDIGCFTMMRGHAHYTGKVNVTMNGNPCQRWDSQVPQDHVYGSEAWHFFRTTKLTEVSNFCRSPWNFHDEKLWCYTKVPGIRWEHCDIPPC